MNTYWPDYYKDFRCITSACRHTCCAGWAVCIDEKSLARFEADPEIAGKISDGCFVMKDDGRCPFLRDDGLCEMILTRGEDYLCDICKEHPRFYNVFDDHIEAGLGLVCEEACRLVLDRDGPFALVADDGTKMDLPPYLQCIFSPAPLTDRLAEISSGRRASAKLRTEIFSQMEVMDPAWSAYLEMVIKNPPTREEEDRIAIDNSRALTNFAAYLLYRYKGAGRFASEATYLIADLIALGLDVHDAARLFSGEVEYSDINIAEALETFS